MVIWIDANISPAIAKFITQKFNIPCFHLDELNVDITDDEVIFKAAKKEADVIITTKDYDFNSIAGTLGFSPENYLAYLWQYSKCYFERKIKSAFDRSFETTQNSGYR